MGRVLPPAGARGPPESHAYTATRAGDAPAPVRRLARGPGTTDTEGTRFHARGALVPRT
jgi:hypothetical protein